MASCHLAAGRVQPMLYSTCYCYQRSRKRAYTYIGGQTLSPQEKTCLLSTMFITIQVLGEREREREREPPYLFDLLFILQRISIFFICHWRKVVENDDKAWPRPYTGEQRGKNRYHFHQHNSLYTERTPCCLILFIFFKSPLFIPAYRRSFFFLYFSLSPGFLFVSYGINSLDSAFFFKIISSRYI